MRGNKELNLKNIKDLVKRINLFRVSVLDLELIPTEVKNLNHGIVKICGGLNGHGNWNMYLNQIQELISHFIDPEILKLEYDLPDDLWYLDLRIIGYENED